MLLAEHEPVRTDEKDDYTPSADEESLCKRIENMFQKAKAHRAKYDANWLTYYRYFRGSQWSKERPTYRHAEVINFVFQTIQSQVPILLDTRPRVEFLPQEPEDLAFAAVMNSIVESLWVKQNWLEVIAEVVFDAHIYGTGFSEVVWDQSKDYGAGDICYRSLDPFHFYVDPVAEDCNKRCRYCIIAEPLPVDYVQNKYPDQKHKIKSDIGEFSKGKIEGDLRKTEWRRPPTEYMPVQQLSGTTTVEDEKKNLTLLITCYFDDEAIVETKEEQEQGEVYVQKKKYPKGRKVVLCSGAILEDIPNEYEDGKFPYQRLQNYILPREFFGMSEVEQLESPQRIFNKLVSFTLDILTLMGNPIWIVSTDSGVDPENIYNRPGLIIEKNPGSEVRREEGTQLQPYVMQLIDRMGQWFNDVAGTQDVSRGATPGSVTAASAIMALQDASQTRIRQKARNIDTYLQSVGQQLASRIMQYYSAPRVFRITNVDGVDQYFKAAIERKDDGSATLYASKWKDDSWQPAGDGEYQLRGELDVRVSTGSSLPFAKGEKESKLLALFDRQIVDAEEVLKQTEYPNYEAVLSRVNQQKQQQAQVQAQSAPTPQ